MHKVASGTVKVVLALSALDSTQFMPGRFCRIGLSVPASPYEATLGASEYTVEYHPGWYTNLILFLTINEFRWQHLADSSVQPAGNWEEIQCLFF